MYDFTFTQAQIDSIEAERFATYEEAELTADDLDNNDGLDARVIEIDGKFAVKIIR